MPRPVLAVLAAVIAALAFAPLGSSAATGSGSAQRTDSDRAAALRLTADWLAAYPEHLWVGVELPGDCRTLPDGRRRCPIAISLRAWTHGSFAPWRCEARAVLPPPQATSAPRHTSARCHELAP